jgi:Flp pilus assembly pilin Flp
MEAVTMVRKEKYLYFYLFLFLLMTLGAFVWQMFFPNVADAFSVWRMSRGWQTEIALWNVGIDMGIVITLTKHNIEYAKILTLISVVLCILLGGHHLIYALTTTNGNITLHWMGAIEVLLIGGGSGIFALIKSNCFKKQ